MSSGRKGFIEGIDWLTILLYGALVMIGIFSIYSAVYKGQPLSFGDLLSFKTTYSKQIIWFGFSIVVAVLIMLIDSKVYPSFAYIIYGVVMLLLLLVLIFGIEVKGSKSWFDLGIIRFQPSELAKFATNLALAKYLSTLNVNLRNIREKMYTFSLIILPIIFILIQGDYGSALVYFSFIFVLHREGLESVFLIIGAIIFVLSIVALLISPFIILATLIVILALGIYLLRKQAKQVIYVFSFVMILSMGYCFSVDFVYDSVLQERHRDRINVLIGKGGNDYNVKQSKIAIGSGGLLGKGYLEGKQKGFVPEPNTDFIFCTISEEKGFAGGIVIIALLVGLILRIIFIAERQRSAFSRIYAYGVACVFLTHFVINLGMTIGFAPVIGIPLPFMSYGGSSLLSFTILLFILLKLDAHRLEVLR